MSEQYRNFMGYLWFQKEDNIYTIGINEEGLEDIETINALDLPSEGEAVQTDVVCGSVDTDDGQLDIYSPVSGNVIEINNAVVEDPELIQEDPYDGWLFKIESEDDPEDSDSDDEDEEDDDEDEEVEEEEE